MGKPSMPAPPPPVDPYAVAQAQGAANVNVAAAQAYMNNPRTVITPFGQTNTTAVSYQSIPFYDESGKKLGTQRVPIFQVSQSLSKDQQALLDKQESVGLGLGNLAESQVARLSGVLNKPINPAALPPEVRNAQAAPNLAAASGLTPALQDTFTRGNLQTSVGPADNFSADRQRYEDALFARINSQLARDRTALEARLANQGVVQGSEAYNRAVDAFGRQSNDARMQAILAAGDEQQRMFGMDVTRGQFANAAQQQGYDQNAALSAFYNQAQQQRAQNELLEADNRNQVAQTNFALDNEWMRNQQTLRQQALQEDIALRNQPIQEISALLSGAQPTVPQMQQFQGSNIAPPPIADTVMANQGHLNQQYGQQMGAHNTGLSGMYGLGNALLGGLFRLSDRRAKRDIRRVGTLDNGLPLYAYRTLGNDAFDLGVMAQDVEQRAPDAVVTIGGMKHVDYARAIG